MRVLITGGAGFIGSHLADLLLADGHQVRALDNLDLQVHPAGERPDYLDGDVELHVGDVRDHDAVARALDGVDAVYHFAAAVGVGQSMYEIERYTSVNSIGAAVVLEEALKRRDAIGKLVVASSMSIYGEGQALSNPYTGVAAIFSSRLLNGNRPLVFEDGQQTRDFIDVRDLVRGCALALTQNGADGSTVNLGTGKPTTIVEVARAIARGLGKEIEPEIVEQYRAGD